MCNPEEICASFNHIKHLLIAPLKIRRNTQGDVIFIITFEEAIQNRNQK